MSAASSSWFRADMAQTYGDIFARLYDRLWSGFATEVAPRIRGFYASQPISQRNHRALDVCCGTGQLAVDLLQHGFEVTGVDLSQPMLDRALANAADFVPDGRARFLLADAADFVLEESFGLVVSTFDALNHLPSLDALSRCFAHVAAATVGGGVFVFDLNTRSGLRRWNGISITEADDVMVVQRGIYDGGDRAQMLVTGFAREEDGRYQRFEESVYNSVFDLAEVRAALLRTGWQSVHFATLEHLGTPVAEPERLGRVFVVAQR
jgi:SAM-dependent methyltransferase